MPENLSRAPSNNKREKRLRGCSRIEQVKRQGISASSETLIVKDHAEALRRPPRCSSETRLDRLVFDPTEHRVPPLNNELHPLHQVWAEIVAFESPSFLHADLIRSGPPSPEFRKTSIQLVDWGASPRSRAISAFTRHCQPGTMRRLLLGERFIEPVYQNHGFNERINYAEIRSIRHAYNENNRPFILMDLAASRTRHSCYMLTFDTPDTRNQAVCTILWRADCLHIIDQLSERHIHPVRFEQLHTDLLRVHRQPSKLTLLTMESYPITLHNASALTYLAESIANIHAKSPFRLIHELAKSPSFIENLDQFLQYIQIPCPQISKILELHCIQPNKTALSEMVIRKTVIKAMTHTNVDLVKCSYRSDEVRACSRLTCVYLSCATGSRLPYLDTSRSHTLAECQTLYEPELSLINVEQFVADLHGYGDCTPHLLTLDNINKIAKLAILQCYQSTEQGCCLTYPSGECYFAKRFAWAQLGVDLLYHAAAFEDWRDKLSEIITPSYLPGVTKTCKKFGDRLEPLLLKLIKHGNAMKISGLLPYARPDAATWLNFSSSKCDPTSTCLSKDVQNNLFKEFLTSFNNATPQPPPTVLKTLADRYFQDILKLAYRNFTPAINLLMKCHTACLITCPVQREEAKNFMRATKKHEEHVRATHLLTAPGGSKEKSFPSKTTDKEVLEFLRTERGGDLEDLNLSSTAITDFVFTVIVNLPKLRRLNLMTTNITDEGLLTLSYAKELKNLNLNECEAITPTGLRHLRRLRNLTTLYVNCTKCDEQAIEELLHSLPNLEYVDLRYTDVSHWGVLKRATESKGTTRTFTHTPATM